MWLDGDPWTFVQHVGSSAPAGVVAVLRGLSQEPSGVRTHCVQMLWQGEAVSLAGPPSVEALDEVLPMVLVLQRPSRLHAIQNGGAWGEWR